MFDGGMIREGPMADADDVRRLALALPGVVEIDSARRRTSSASAIGPSRIMPPSNIACPGDKEGMRHVTQGSRGEGDA